MRPNIPVSVLWATFVSVVASSSVSAQLQLLSNTGFETVTGIIPDGWTVSNCDSQLDGKYGTPAHSGARMLQAATHYGYKVGIAEQTVALAPGFYDLELSVFIWLRDDGAWPSSGSVELLVDGSVVASAHMTQPSAGTTQITPTYTQAVTAWAGTVTAQATVRITAIADGPGGNGWGIVGIDDIALWSRSCGTQHEVDDITPNVLDAPAADQTVTLTGTGLDNVTDVRLWRSGFDRIEGEALQIPSTALNATIGGTSLDVDLSTLNAPAGFYDVIIEQSGCNARVVTGGLQVRDPAAFPNLLVNASFEIDDEAGNSVIWFGDYRHDQAPFPTPKFKDGDFAWANSVGEAGDTENTTTWQEILVDSGSTVDVTGSVVCTVDGVGASTCDVTVNLWDMTLPSPTLIDTFSIDETTPPSGVDDWVDVTLSGVANSGAVSIEIMTTLFAADYFTPVSASADQFVLTASPACATQHRALYAYPGLGTHDADSTITITGGSQLDQVTAVSLVFVDAPAEGDQPEVVVPGTLDSVSPTQLIATFPIGTNGAPEGLYNLVVAQGSCPAANLEVAQVYRSLSPNTQPLVPPSFLDQFSVICSNPTTMTGVSPDVILSDEGEVELTLSGLNVTAIDSVALVQNGTVIPGSNLTVLGNDLVATFDLTGSPCGMYEVHAGRSDGCNDPTILPAALRYVKPGCNVLLNGDFEEEGPKGTDATPVARWQLTNDSTTQVIKYDGSFFQVTDGYNGTDNRGSLDQSGGSLFSTGRAYQTQPAMPGLDATLTGAIYVGDFNAADHTHYVLLRDGDQDGPIIDSFEIQQAGPGETVWTPFTITGKATTTQVTVEWGHYPNPGGTATGLATHVDELVLTYSPLPCNEPFADADSDGDVDQNDFAFIQLCITGGMLGHPPIPSEPAICPCFDRDIDLDIDQADINAFADCATGSGVIHAINPNPSCSE